MLPDSDHNQELTPDELSGVLLNYEWRRVIVGILERELPRIAPVDISETDMNTYQDRIDALIEDIYTIEVTNMGVEYRQSIRTTAQSLPTSGEQSIIWQSGDHNIANPTRMVAPITGIATIEVSFLVTQTNLTDCFVRIVKNGSTVLVRRRTGANATSHWISVSITRRLEINDYVEVIVQCNGTANIDVAAGQSPIITLTMAVEI